MNPLFGLIGMVLLAIIGVLVIIGDAILCYICTKFPKIDAWFYNLPMNKEE